MWSAINVSSFNSACWIFAARYWLFSHLLSSSLKQDFTAHNKLTRYGLVMWFGLIAIQGLTVFYIIVTYKNSIPLSLQGSIIPPIYLASTIFLADGLNRIRKVMKAMSNEIIIFRGFVMHLSAFLMFLLATTLPNFIMSLTSAYSNFPY